MLWRRRKAQSKIPSRPTKYPHGTFVETEKGYFYIRDDAKRYRVISERVLQSWAPHRVAKSSEAALANYRIAARLKFRNGSLIWSLSDGKLYLIENGKRRHVVSPDALNRIGAVQDDALVVSSEEIQLHEIGEELS